MKRSWPNFKALSRYLTSGTEESHDKLVRIAGLRAENLTGDLPVTSVSTNRQITTFGPESYPGHLPIRLKPP
jgi:hypothetical protein